MKPNRSERLSEHLLNVDEDLLAAAYEIDNAEKLKAYAETPTARGKAVPFPRRRVWVPIVAAAACVALTVGLWQGGVFGPAEIPVEGTVAGTTTTEPTENTTKDSAIVPTTEATEPNDPTDEPTADTTTDTERSDKTETKKPTATDKTDPTKAEKTTTSVTGDTDKTNLTKTTTTGKGKPTTKPTTGKTKPTTPTATTETEWSVITADKPDTGYLDKIEEEGLDAFYCTEPITPLLKEKMKLYKDTNAQYVVAVAINYPIKPYRSAIPNDPSIDPAYYNAYQQFAKTEEMAKLIEETQRAWEAYMEADEIRRENIGNDAGAPEIVANCEKAKSYYFSLRRERDDRATAFYWDFHNSVMTQQLQTLKDRSDVEVVEITDKTRYPYSLVCRYSWSGAYFAVLSADEINELAESGGYKFWLCSSEVKTDLDIFLGVDFYYSD